MAANDILKDRAITHAVNTQRLTTNEVNEVLKLLRSVDRDLVKKIESRGVDGTWTTDRLNRLLRSIRESTIKDYRRLREQLKKQMRPIAGAEIEFATTGLDAALQGTVTAVAPTAGQAFAAAVSKPFQGQLLSKWFNQLAGNKQVAVERALRQGVIEGESVPQVTRRIRDITKIHRRHAEAVSRTAINHVVTQSRSTTYEANADIIKGEQWVATLDARTSDICITLDGKVFPLGKGPRPPAHINCRSTTTPVTKSFKELGLPFKEFPVTTRASINGQIPATTTYRQWIKNQPAAVQDEVLGKKRGRLLRQGKMEVDRFFDPTGKRYTLEQLRRREADVFKKAGLE